MLILMANGAIAKIIQRTYGQAYLVQLIGSKNVLGEQLVHS
ncbi:MAG: hypothetical protein AAFY33_09420 [Cyanobacteria bacterium J06643_4]